MTFTATPLAAATLSLGAQAQSFPEASQTITIVVPFVPGGPTDKVARDLAESLRKNLNGANVVVENVAGAGATIGAGRVAKAKPDGYTLLLHHVGMATTGALYRKPTFDPAKDFEYLGVINDVPMTVVARNTLPVSNIKEFTAWINANKGKIKLGNAGLGSASHLCGAMFQDALKVDMTTISYKGTAQAMTDLIGGQIDFMCDQTTNTSPQIQGKTIKGLAVTTPSRISTPALKDLPTLDESGMKGFNVTIWHGLYAPKGTPPEALKSLHGALHKAVADPEFIKRQEALGADVVKASDKRLDPVGHKAFVMTEVDKLGKVLKAAGQFAD